MVDRLDSWAAVATTFQRYGHCDDGSIAEGNAEAIGHLLADHWEKLPQLATLTVRLPGFQAWVLRHVNTTLDTAMLETIKRRATKPCTPITAALCGTLRVASARALTAAR